MVLFALLALFGLMAVAGIIAMVVAARQRAQVPPDKRAGVARSTLVTGIVLTSVGGAGALVLGVAVVFLVWLADALR
jgi:hypothetical protein